MTAILLGCGGGSSGTDGSSTTRVSGQIINQTGTGIGSARVFIAETSDSAISDAEGNFEIPAAQIDEPRVTFLVEAGDTEASSTLSGIEPQPQAIDVLLQLNDQEKQLEIVDSVVEVRPTPQPKKTPTPSAGDNEGQNQPVDVTVRIKGLGYSFKFAAYLPPIGGGNRAFAGDGGVAEARYSMTSEYFRNPFYLSTNLCRASLDFTGIRRRNKSIEIEITQYVKGFLTSGLKCGFTIDKVTVGDGRDTINANISDQLSGNPRADGYVKLTDGVELSVNINDVGGEPAYYDAYLNQPNINSVRYYITPDRRKVGIVLDPTQAAPSSLDLLILSPYGTTDLKISDIPPSNALVNLEIVPELGLDQFGNNVPTARINKITVTQRE